MLIDRIETLRCAALQRSARLGKERVGTALSGMERRELFIAPPFGGTLIRTISRGDFIRLTAAAEIGSFVCFGDAGAAHAGTMGRRFVLQNDAVAALWEIDDAAFRPVLFRNRRTGSSLALPSDAFSVLYENGPLENSGPIASSRMKIVGAPRQHMLQADPRAARVSERLGGREIIVELIDEATGLHAEWRGILRDGSHYVRQEVTFTATRKAVPLSEIRMVDLDLRGATVAGIVQGSPIVAGSMFFGYEDPISQAEVSGTRARIFRSVSLPLEHERRFVASTVMGTAVRGQIRRDFLRYVERERAHPYRTFLHYNSWYDLGHFTPYTAAQGVQRINAFGEILSVQRGVKLDSFLFDDGWDDYSGAWNFNSGFPDGFTPLKIAAQKYGGDPGCWLSPWGGYGKPHDLRVAGAKKAGLETDANGLALSGPRYYRLFEGRCLELVQKYGINQFKFDGTGSTDTTVRGSTFNSDFDAAIHLIEVLRAAEPDLYINLTTGTYPSPFWLKYADSIWRGGYDHNFAGPGSWRQQWITYRDLDTYRGIVLGGPLYPLNSLMLHGMIYAQHAKHLADDPHGDFGDEVRSYFGTGTQLQEMYITPELLSADNWNVIAEAAKWSRSGAQTLVDVHWIGGDPGELEPYGHAAWSPRKGIISLRNPSDRPQSIALDPGQAFELPDGAAKRYRLRSPWAGDPHRSPLELQAGRSHRFNLEPFEVLTFDAAPIP
ncbi:MAG: enterotoxin [Candidatus Baltobacteraceae bacterium]